jgi:hypothetical protein
MPALFEVLAHSTIALAMADFLVDIPVLLEDGLAVSVARIIDCQFGQYLNSLLPSALVLRLSTRLPLRHCGIPILEPRT